MRRRLHLVLLTGLLAAACGSDSTPSSPSSTSSATIQGTVNGSGTSSNGLAATAVSSAAAQAGIRVTVMGTGLSTTTDASGRFTLTGITTDSIVLHFEGSGIDATLEIGGLVPGQTLTIKVKVSGHQAAFEDDDNNGGGSSAPVASKCFAAGDKAEVEGNISAKGSKDITVAQQGKGDYLCQVSATTSIRHGNTSFGFADLKIGDHVHVSGTGLGLSGAVCRVAASEVKIQ
jgi:hypothetical protein